MWNGQYHFFDYKYNIEGYSGQDYDGAARYIYMIFTIVSIIALLILLRRTSKKGMERYNKVLACLMPVLEITKVTWESWWDVTSGRGFNWGGLLPLYTCSLFIYCMLFVGFGKGKIKEYCAFWVAVYGFVGGFSNVLFIRGLNWYPFWTFGAFYSMFFHYIMVFTAWFYVITGYVKFRWNDILKAFAVNTAFSVPVIVLNSVFDWDYMQYRDAGGVPLIEGIVDKFKEAGQGWLSVPLMLLVYFALAAFLVAVYMGVQKLISVCKKEK